MMNSNPESMPHIYDPPLDLPSYGGGFLVHSYGEEHEKGEPNFEDAYYVMWRFVHGGFSVNKSRGDEPEYHINILDPESDELGPLGQFPDESPVAPEDRLIVRRYIGVNTVVEVQAYAKGQPLDEAEYHYMEVEGKPDLEEKILQPEVLAKHLPEYTAEARALVSEQFSKDFGISPKVA